MAEGGSGKWAQVTYPQKRAAGGSGVRGGARLILLNLAAGRAAAGALPSTGPCLALEPGQQGVRALPAPIRRNLRHNRVRGASGRQGVAEGGSGNLRQGRAAPEIQATRAVRA